MAHHLNGHKGRYLMNPNYNPKKVSAVTKREHSKGVVAFVIFFYIANVFLRVEISYTMRIQDERI